MVRHEVVAPCGLVFDEAQGDWPAHHCQVGAAPVVQRRPVLDTCRFARTRTLPLSLEFTDAACIRHKVTIEKTKDVYTIVFPVRRSEVKWEGDRSDRTRIAGNIAKVTFTYHPRSAFRSHGIRVKATGGTLQSKDLACSERWLEWARLQPVVVPQQPSNLLSRVADACQRAASLLGVPVCCGGDKGDFKRRAYTW